MKLALFGVTGTCGGPLLDAALGEGHEVRALARAPQKLDRAHPRLAVVTGDALDPDAVAATIAGADAVLSTLGGFRGPESLDGGTRHILAAMRRHGVRRLVAVQGVHLRFPGDPRNVGQVLLGGIMRTVGRDIVTHGHAMARLLLDDDLDWTLLRIPRVTGAGASGHRIGTLRLGPWSHVTTGDVVRVALALVAIEDWIRQAPMLASGRPGRAAAFTERAKRRSSRPQRAESRR